MQQNKKEQMIAKILGLETDPRGVENMFLIRDENGKLIEGINFSDEVKQISELISKVRQEAVEEERKRIKKHIYLMRKENTLQRNETISEILYSIENEYIKALSLVKKEGK